MICKSLETQVSEALALAGIKPDKVDRHGQDALKVKFIKSDNAETVRLYDRARRVAWRVFEAIPESEVLDYYDTIEAGTDYHVVVLRPNLSRVVLPPKKEPKPKPARRPNQKVLLGFKVGEQVWVAVKFGGKPVRVKGEVRRVMAGKAVVQSNRTSQEYTVPGNLIFNRKPGEEVLRLVS